MGQLTYNRTRDVAVAGMVSQDCCECVVSYPAAEDIEPGTFVVLNSSGQCEPPQDTSLGKPLGVAVFSPTSMQPAVPAAGFVYKAGDMVPILRKGRCYVKYNGGSPATYTQAHVKHSSTIATYRGYATASATSAGAGVEISDLGPVMFVEAGPSGVWLMEVCFPGQVIDADTRLTALEADAATANASFDVPLTAFVDPDGDPLAKYSAGNTGVPGFNLVNSEALCIEWNNYPDNPGVTIRAQTALPADLDDGAAVIVECLTSKTGATAGDTGILTLAAFILSAGDLNNADADCGGDMAGMTANATAGTTADQSFTIVASAVPAGARTMSFSLTPKTGTLQTDDILLHSVRVRYTRKVQTS